MVGGAAYPNIRTWRVCDMKRCGQRLSCCDNPAIRCCITFAGRYICVKPRSPIQSHINGCRQCGSLAGWQSLRCRSQVDFASKAAHIW